MVSFFCPFPTACFANELVAARALVLVWVLGSPMLEVGLLPQPPL
jgi:hypothetical protein